MQNVMRALEICTATKPPVLKSLCARTGQCYTSSSQLQCATHRAHRSVLHIKFTAVCYTSNLTTAHPSHSCILHNSCAIIRAVCYASSSPNNKNTAVQLDNDNRVITGKQINAKTCSWITLSCNWTAKIAEKPFAATFAAARVRASLNMECCCKQQHQHSQQHKQLHVAGKTSMI